MNIRSLLNPEIKEHFVFAPRRRSSIRTKARQRNVNTREGSVDSLSDIPLKQQRLKEAKDGPKFEKGDPKGDVLYAPYETEPQETELIKQHTKFCIYPRKDIGTFPRQIPYSSDKKAFMAKTGKSGFEVFHYTFKDLKGSEWTVMWDYNDGLVRITPFFKCLNYGKTIPAKAIGASPGLKELSHSITGGALAAQGYWIPYQAARALAATFCWEIRYALTPLFGPAFVSECIHPEDPAFKRYTINPAIVEACAAGLRCGKLDSASRKLGQSKLRNQQPPPESLLNGIGGADEPTPTQPRSLRPRIHSSSAISPFSDSDTIDGTPSEEAVTTPPSPPLPSSSVSSWTAANDGLLFHKKAPSPVLSSSSWPSSKRPHSDILDHAPSSTTGSGKGFASSNRASRTKKRKVGMFEADEARAAYMLLQLSVAERAIFKP